MRFLSRLSAILAVIGSFVVLPDEVSASGLGCDTSQITDAPVVVNPVSVDLVIPFGYLCHLMKSTGKAISEQRAAYTSNSNIYGPLVRDICNWRIDFVYYGMDGKEYMRDKGETINGCKGASRIVEKSKTLPQFGSTCAELFVDGTVRLIQCHGMTE